MKINNRIASCQLASTGPIQSAQGQDVLARKIYVSHVQFEIHPERLRGFFGKFGDIETGLLGLILYSVHREVHFLMIGDVQKLKPFLYLAQPWLCIL
ncbi:hypothetical protein RJ640_001944 [Escallonia rubra]|uniref:Uncharacterized protein n=1 Tax=Escallonia rubra TaxID=112253 RepID=A0AA88QHF2_9ASTE|nr:hypothetical protein RJ640_001944 [Escallonia rubra]